MERAIVRDEGPGETLTSPAWSGTTGAINTNTKTYLTINGQGNLTITNSANGDGLANQQISV